ncbi:MAG: hypothetical protein M5U08_04630 [Burkholderiales bacterium]|nr:hypothetical protein [Burkholderiales bacterium]
MNGEGIATGLTVDLLVYGGLIAFAAYQLLFWFGERERRSLHLAAAALFFALAHAFSGELAALVLPARLRQWHAELAVALPLLAAAALMSFARVHLAIAHLESDLAGAMHGVVLAGLAAAASAPAWAGAAVAPWVASAIVAAALGLLAVMAARLWRSIYRAPRYWWPMLAALIGLLAMLAARPHRVLSADARLEYAHELGTVALLLALGYAVAARARVERRAGRDAALRSYIGEALAAEAVARAEQDAKAAPRPARRGARRARGGGCRRARRRRDRSALGPRVPVRRAAARARSTQRAARAGGALQARR